MLPPADHSLTAGTRAGPACPCALKPLPCLVDTWVTGNSIPYEQPLSIQTDMEYTLDTRLFPGWDPVTGQTQPALVIDTAMLTARSQAAAAAPPVAMTGVASLSTACPPLTRTRAAAAGGHGHTQRNAAAAAAQVHVAQQQQTRGRYRQAAAVRGAVHASRTPATPAELPPAPAASYHPAFRPTEPHFRPAPPNFRQHRPLQQHPDSLTVLPQQPQANPDNDLLALIASIDVEPAGYQLDVDWLIGHHHHHQQAAPPASAAAYSATQLAAVTPQHHHLHHHHHQHQRAVPCPAPLPPAGPTGIQTTFTPDLTDYQSQFYPGASWGGNGGGIVSISCSGSGIIGGTSGTGCTSGLMPMNTAAVLGSYLQTRVAPQVVMGGGKSRSSKRRLPVESPCEGAVPVDVPVAFIDLTQSPNPKRVRWTGGWTGVYGQGGLGLTHVPSPLQNRAY